MLPYKWGPPAFPIKKAEMDSLLLNTAAPSTIDWRTRNAVTPVKNQGWFQKVNLRTRVSSFVDMGIPFHKGKLSRGNHS
jgi:hypothetical protein